MNNLIEENHKVKNLDKIKMYINIINIYKNKKNLNNENYNIELSNKQLLKNNNKKITNDILNKNKNHY